MRRWTVIGRRWLALTGLLLGGVGVAHALALGDISAHSALGQPFAAVIPLTLDAGESLGDVRISVADRSAYRRLNLFYVRALALLKVRVVRDGAGLPEARISSREPMDEPALELLLDARWGGGRTLREYVVLLNPPASSPTPQTVSAPAPQPVAAPPVAPAPAAEPAIYGPVGRGEILSGIAHRFKPRGASTLQMMVAIYNANPHAFAHGDMNRLRRGTRLFLPSDAAVYAVTRHQAAVAMRAQSAARRSPAAVAGTAPAAVASLQILTPAPLSKTHLAADLQRRLMVIHRDNAEVRAENEQLRAQLAQLEQQTKVLEAKILALPMPAASAGTSAAVPSQVAAAAASSPPMTEQVGDVAPPVAVPADPKSWWRDPFWWVAIVAVLASIAILAVAIMFWRRSRQPLYREFRVALRDDDSVPFGRFRPFQ